MVKYSSSEIFVDRFHPVAHMKLFINMVNVFSNRFLTNVKVCCNFFIEQPDGQLLQDLIFPVR